MWPYIPGTKCVVLVLQKKHIKAEKKYSRDGYQYTQNQSEAKPIYGRWL